MPKGYPNKKPETVTHEAAPPSLPEVDKYDPYAPRHVPEPEPVGPKMQAMKLERNYRPMSSAFEIVGHFKPAVFKKKPDGELAMVSPEEFIDGEQAPPPRAGVGFANKFWAGTVMKLPIEEAKTMRRLGIATVELADD